MASREAVTRALVEIRSWFPNLPDTGIVLDGAHRDLADFDDAELGVATRTIVRERKRQQGAPSIGDIREACVMAARIRRASAISEHVRTTADAFCAFCGTTALVWSVPWPNGQRRMLPDHASHCRLAGGNDVPPASVNMAAWPGQKRKTHQPEPVERPTQIGAVVGRVTP